MEMPVSGSDSSCRLTVTGFRLEGLGLSLWVVAFEL